MTKIIWGINVPYKSTEIDWEATDRIPGYGFHPVRKPCIRVHKQMSFELCDVCGTQIPWGRVNRKITTCNPEHNAKKWDSINGLVIEKERNLVGVRPTMFWLTISHECFERDNWTCQTCKTHTTILTKQRESEKMINGKVNPNYDYTDYVLNCHHIKPIKDGGNNRLENLITLCGKCHKKEHSRVKNVERKHKSFDSFTD
jgi:5-methylcytosine-specific restriction endonuclease McrA